MPTLARGILIAVGGAASVLLFCVSTAAQQNCTNPCPAVHWVPISGTVVDAVDGHPIAGAMVRYIGLATALRPGTNLTAPKMEPGPVSEPLIPIDAFLNPPSMRGEVKTAADGTFTLPQLAPGEFAVHVSAPGYLSEMQHLAEHPAGYRPPPPPQLPSSICMARTGSPNCFAPPNPDGNFHLQPDVLHLQSMSADALARFGPPVLPVAGRKFVTVGFAPEANKIGFVTLDNEMKEGETTPDRHCRAWTYDLENGSLSVADLPEAPFSWEQETDCSSDKNLTWNGDGYYFSTARVTGNPNHSTVESVRRTDARAIPDARELPASVQDDLRRNVASDLLVTDDGRFSVGMMAQGDEDAPRGGCMALTAMPAQDSKSATVLTDCGIFISYLLDGKRDLVYVATQSTNDPRVNDQGALVEFNLSTGVRRTFSLPVYGRHPEFLALQALDDGGTRVAYAFSQLTEPVAADCDLAASEYYPWPTQVIRPPGDFRPDQNGHAPAKFSVCFVTVPAAPDSASTPLRANP